MQLNNLPQYFFQYKFATRAVSEGRYLSVATTFPHDDWVTVPWDTIVTAPADDSGVYNPKVGDGGEAFWSFLYGPAIFSMTAALGVGDVQPRASVHFQPYAADSDSETMVASWEGWEWFVGDLEDNTRHFTGAWWGHLPAGARLRLRVDYWHATEAARFNRAHVEGAYWRLPAA